ncbi:hypothetical protein M2272_004953 [Mycobacterium frederiksbergense]|uniref:Uncharacterized protein n=1 Tax=Mycolicibacterium frederiksbergense TaxID=117567 RepID=A0ABT6L5T9_9MYCO|nr:hypothetical protein [Mycolicibacterium frederiksbergense]MDH6198294.1 hypothetical protein [Mycolicibacterium frederiksbergense]
MSRWDDDIALQPFGTVQPTTVAALLRALRLSDASEGKKTAAIEAWLNDHQPSETMKASLRRNGYAKLLIRGASA